MRVVLQRVTSAAVTIKETGDRRSIGPGLAVLLGVGHGDDAGDVDYLVQKVTSLRIFADEHGKMNLSLEDVQGQMLIVSQFTLLGDTRKGKRPSFTDAAPPAIAIPLYERFVAQVQARGVTARTGEFGADMSVEITNDGPVTLIIESPPKTNTEQKKEERVSERL
ncbi:D-aminoacyl-tRNA deacylase [Capsulimonas corticalis]|uniref:D-aminoacyl-tRNA deacylase n=1 Tax=Capsulimonas corticalis TaxID=2219043 RepID=A0A9N7L5Q5_9BACT|nr:D-aminoacyl-tRNA deacylase [Capsulimonas corticalis]BDI32713.1 D-aminoacyl-tRNA deacylase [Capsulimonas corticalis]